MVTQEGIITEPEIRLGEMEMHAVEAAALLKRLSHPVRLLLACTLAEGEYSVGALEHKLDIHQPNLSQQLGVLRDARIVETRRDAKQIFYKLTEDKAAQVIRALYAIFCTPEQQI